MNKAISAFMMAALAFGAGTFIDNHAAHAQASATVGSLRGEIKDKANGEAAPGATVVATSPALQGEQVVITDEGGLYFITSLPPGTYTLTVYYNDGTFSRGNVLIQVGKEAVVNVTIDSGAGAGKPKGEVIQIRGTAPVIDQGSTKTGVTLTDDYTRNVPTGRTFGEVLGAAASAQGDFYGTSLSGATSVENTYVVEGINTTDTAYGALSSNLPNEFVQETEIITGGYNAEYGRATGGIVNVVTKQGSNEFHGSVFGYYTPGALVATAKTIQREGNSVDTQSNLDYTWDVGAELGGPIIKDKLWFHVGFDPQVSQTTVSRLVQAQEYDQATGAAKIDPATGLTVHDRVASEDIPNQQRTYSFTAKINGAIDQNNQFQISAFGNPRNGNYSDLNSGIGTAVFAPQDTLYNQKDGAYDVSGRYTSKFNEGKTQIDAVVGFHHGYTLQSSPSAVGSEPLTQYKYERSLYDFSDLEGPQTIAACNDHPVNGPGSAPGFRLCPITNYADQGLGFLEQRNNDRTSAVLSVTQRVKFLGYHLFKAGVDYEGSTYNTTQFDTGGVALQRACNTDPTTGACSDAANALPGVWQANSYDQIVGNLTPAQIAANMADPNAFGKTLPSGQAVCSGGLAICGPVNNRLANTSDRSIGAYLQDSWQVRPNFTLNLGVRFEQQAALTASQLVGTASPTGEIVPSTAFTLNNWAPRLGIIWDPTEEGKSKIFGHYGWFYENVPMDINVRSFGGEIDNIRLLNASQTSTNPNCAADHGNPNTPNAGLAIQNCPDAVTEGLFGGGTEYVAPGLKGQYTQELVLGAEYEIMPDFKASLTWTHRTLPTIIEDMSTDGGNDYLVANPGQNYDAQAAELHAQAQAIMTTNPNLASALELRSQELSFIKNEDPPSRNYDAVTVRLEQRPTHKSLLMASYTYSVEKGNYPGLFSTETNQLDPNITSQYDLPELLGNRYGFLGLDRPHNLKVDGFYLFDLKKAGQLTTGVSARAQSGIPVDTLGGHPTYGLGESYLLPRGAFAREPVTSELDIHIAYGYKIDKKRTLEAFMDVFNLFNTQDELVVDENYTFDNANPIVGGDSKDLMHEKSEDANGVPQNITLTPNNNFNQATQLTLPRSFRFGLRLLF